MTENITTVIITELGTVNAAGLEVVVTTHRSDRSGWACAADAVANWTARGLFAKPGASHYGNGIMTVKAETNAELLAAGIIHDFTRTTFEDAEPVAPFVSTRAASIEYTDAAIPAPAGWPADVWQSVTEGRISYRRATEIVAAQPSAAVAPAELERAGVELTITHTHEAGTLIEGTAKGDGSADALKASGWRWSRNMGAWYVPQSRDRAPKLATIARTRAALEAAGFAIVEAIDSTARSTAEVEAAKIDRQADRVDALQAKAERKSAADDAAYAKARAALDRLPEGGEPVKIGHHSEGRHRNAIDRAGRAMTKSVQAGEVAREAAAKAEAATHTTGARYNVVTVANRIKKLGADVRDRERKLAGYSNNLGDTFAAASGAHAERLTDNLAELRDQLAFWEGVRADQIAAGTATNYGPDTIAKGDTVYAWHGWREVARVNAKSVTVLVPVHATYTAKHTAPYAELKGHRPAVVAEVENAADEVEQPSGEVEPAPIVADVADEVEPRVPGETPVPSAVAAARARVVELVRTRAELDARFITPRSVVGTGYKNGRKVAEEYLDAETARARAVLAELEGIAVSIDTVAPSPTREAAAWTLSLDGARSRALLNGHRSRRVDLERGGLVVTDATAADTWLIEQHRADIEDAAAEVAPATLPRGPWAGPADIAHLFGLENLAGA